MNPNRPSYLPIPFILLLFTISLAHGLEIPDRQDNLRAEHVPGELIIRLKTQPGLTGIGVLSRFKAEGIRTAQRLVPQENHPLAGVYIARIDPDLDPAKTAESISKMDGVLYAEPNLILRICTTPDDPFYSSTGSWGQAYDDLWGLKKIGLSELGTNSGWDIERDEGGNIVVAVIDTGLDLGHPDIQGNIWTNPGEIPDNGLDDDFNGYIDDVHGWNFVSKTRNPSDGHGHGTHCAGTIAARTNNALGVAGVSWGSRIMPLKGLSDSGGGWISDLAEALIYAADNGANIISNSWGGSGTSSLLEDAVAYAASAGCLVTAAAGNSSLDVEAFQFIPASYTEAMAVAALSPYDTAASFSNYGEAVEVSAPGVDILSLRAAGTDMYGDGSRIVGVDYIRASGTSMACPHVSGLAALVWAHNPSWNAAQVRQHLIQTTDYIDLHNPGLEGLLGSGRINAWKALTVEPQPDLVASAVQVVPHENITQNAGIDPGETVGLTVTLLNRWLNATDVSANLLSSDPFITVDETPVSFGSIASGERVDSPVSFTITASPDTPYNHPFAVSLAVTAGGGYEAILPLNLKATFPSLSVRSGHIDDATGNANGLLEPGETVSLRLSLLNMAGSATARNVTGELVSLDPKITVHQSSGEFGSIPHGRVRMNESTPFVVEMAPDFPPGKEAALRLNLQAEHGYSLSIDLEITLPNTPRIFWACDSVWPPARLEFSTAGGPTGSMHLAYETYSLGQPSRIAYARWAGGIWSGPDHVARHRMSPTRPLVEADASDNPHVLWEEMALAPGLHPVPVLITEFYHATRKQEWTRARGMSESWAIEAIKGYGIASDESGDVHAVWLFADYGVSPTRMAWYHNVYRNGEWLGMTVIRQENHAGQYFMNLRLMPEPGGKLWFTWWELNVGNPTRTLRGMRWNGSSWSTPVVFLSAQVDLSTYRIAAGTDGRLHLVWSDRPANSRWYTVSNPQVTQWSEPISLAPTDPTPEYGISTSPNSLFMDVDGLLHFAYNLNRIVKTRVLENGTWSQPEDLLTVPSGEEVRDLQMLTDGRGRRHLFWGVEKPYGYLRLYHVLLSAVNLRPEPTPVPDPGSGPYIHLK